MITIIFTEFRIENRSSEIREEIRLFFVLQLLVIIRLK